MSLFTTHFRPISADEFSYQKRPPYQTLSYTRSAHAYMFFQWLTMDEIAELKYDIDKKLEKVSLSECGEQKTVEPLHRPTPRICVHPHLDLLLGTLQHPGFWHERNVADYNKQIIRTVIISMSQKITELTAGYSVEGQFLTIEC